MTTKGHAEFKGFQIRPIMHTALDDYSDLLAKSFQNFNPTAEYLNWLYFKNPRGFALGYDAYDGDTLIAHYASVPIKISGYRFNSLLSLNTATHPAYQGRGLFRVLAEKTFEIAATEFSNVVGVANSKSVGGFVRHLGFDAIGNLELRLGTLTRQSEGSKIYSKEELSWRMNCPRKSLNSFPLGDYSHLLSVKPFRYAPSLKAIVFEEGERSTNSKTNKVGLTLDWRKGVQPILKLPRRFKPSPLVLIHKPLLETNVDVLTSFSFPDFDAF